MRPGLDRTDFRYQAYYCEENAWFVASDDRLSDLERWLVFVTNRGRTCLMWGQRAGQGGPVVWDYHVFVVARREGRLEVFDLDTTLGFPVSLDRYIAGAFPEPDRWTEAFQPMFRVVASDDALPRFASDRRHMRDPTGGWSAPPPAWPPIQGRGQPHDLDHWLDLDLDESGRGRVVSLNGLWDAFANSAADRVGP